MANTSSAPILTKTIANLITGNLLALSEKNGRPVSELISPENLIELARLFESKELNNQGVQKVLEVLIENPDQKTFEVVESAGLRQMNDNGALQAFVDVVIHNNLKVVEEYKSGKTQVIGFLVGQCMKESKGKGNPQKFNALLKSTLDK